MVSLFPPYRRVFMDFKVSRKERRLQPDGPVDVLMDNICDLYPIYGNDPRFAGQDIFIGQDRITGPDLANLIMDVEMLDDDREELLDRAMFAVMKQRGGDPVEPDDGIQWAESVIGEVSAPIIVQQVHKAVQEEGPGVRVTPYTVKNKNGENLAIKIELTNAV
jgi:hypothetical protein